MRTLVSSLKRLYESSRVAKGKLLDMYEKGTLDRAEYYYIVGEETK